MILKNLASYCDATRQYTATFVQKCVAEFLHATERIVAGFVAESSH